MNENDLTDFYDVKGFAKKIKVHPNTVYIAIKDGRINAFRVTSSKRSRFRIPATEINMMATKDMQKRMEEK